jgi:opacity protein-like surface antigen
MSMIRPIALLKYGPVALALLAMPSPAVAQSAEELRAEVEALRKENAMLRERHRLAKQNSALHDRLTQRPASAPITGAHRAALSAREPNPLQANAADLPVKAPAPAPVVALPNWAGVYVGGGISREQRKTTQGDVLVTSNPVPTFGDATLTRDLTLEQFTTGGHVLGGWLWQYQRFIIGFEGDYYFGSHTNKDPRYLVPENCSAGVIVTGNFGCGSGAAFGSFKTRGHARGIAGWEITPNFMGFVAGGLAIGELGAGGIQVGGLIADSPSQPQAGSASSSYGRQMLYGWSWGGGVQTKINESLIGRVEYLRDQYDGPSQRSTSFTATAGASSVTATSRPQDMRIVNQALRASLIYRFDPNVPFYEASARDFAAFGRWQSSNNGFAGFYAGVGVSQNNYDYRMEDATTISINDNTQPGLELNQVNDSFLKGGNVGKNFLIGYRYQFARFLIGAEREFVRDSRKDLDKSTNTMGFTSPGKDFLCYPGFPADFICVGLGTTTGAVETRGRLRAIGGVELTPSLMAFGGYGRAYGQARGLSGSSQGVVASNPSSPLVGAATVTRAQTNDITGHTFGGGVEFKAMENLIFRVDYWRDHYTWDAIVTGGAGFGGTIGNVTVNSFNQGKTPVKITNEAFQASVVYRFWNPQGGGASAGGESLLAALAGAVGSPLAAFAKAGPVYKAPPGVAPAGYTWTGFYAGAHGGYGWSHQDWTRVNIASTSFEGAFNADGWLAGAQLGYNHQINQFVIGIELDGSFTDIVGRRASLLSLPGQQPIGIKVEVEGLATVAGRLGLAWNNILFYGKGGAAFARNHPQYTDNDNGNAHVWKVGWMAGGGAEYGITPTISAKLEYNYMDFGTQHYTLTCQIVSCGTNRVDLEQNFHVVKAGLNWRFWNPGPVVARY